VRARIAGASAGVVALRLRGRAVLALLLVSVVGLAAFGWPLLARPTSGIGHDSDAPWLFAVLVVLLVLVLLAELSSGGIDAKAIALLGVLAAVGAALRPFGGTVTGFQPMFVLLVLGGRALGPGFGFLLGSVTMFASSLLTGGVGPWLPFQMLGAAWVGLLAGLLPPARGRRELVMLAGYGAVSGVAYGFLLNLWFWPFTTGLSSSVAFSPGAPVSENLGRFLAFSLATSLGWDLTRGLGTAVLVLVAGGPVLRALRRAARRAAFDVPVSFLPGSPSDREPVPAPVPETAPPAGRTGG
jgi:energy-coupling factor transport system substrate-specific component